MRLEILNWHLCNVKLRLLSRNVRHNVPFWRPSLSRRCSWINLVGWKALCGITNHTMVLSRNELWLLKWDKIDRLMSKYQHDLNIPSRGPYPSTSYCCNRFAHKAGPSSLTLKQKYPPFTLPRNSQVKHFFSLGAVEWLSQYQAHYSLNGARNVKPTMHSKTKKKKVVAEIWNVLLLQQLNSA
jgi:hypothetical protein